MKTLLTATALALTFGSSAFAFDAGTQAIIDRQKANKPVSMANIGALMRASERWCYLEEAGTCSWSDIYLDVTEDGARFEIGNAWSDTVDIAFTDTGTFKDGRYICETGTDWIPTLRASYRADGSMVRGRALETLKDEVAAMQSNDAINCFDYVYLSSDAASQTIKLRQRQSTDDVHDPARDVEVTLHFDPTDAAALTWRW